MNKKVFPQLGEQYFEQRMENGMMVRVVESRVLRRNMRLWR